MGEFLVSVANMILRDPITKNGIAYGKANIASAFNITMQNADVRAGINNKLLYSYYHTREVNLSVEDATFSESIIAINVGSSAIVGAANVLQTDCLTLSSSGSGTITSTPIGNVNVFLPDGSIQTVTPSVKNINVSGGAGLKVDCIYTTSKSVSQITVGATTPPDIVDVTLIAEIRTSATREVVKYLQINVPSFQVAGNYSLSLTANGVSSQKLEGKALAVTASDCTSEDYYAKCSWIPVTASSAYSQIAATPSSITFSHLAVPASQSITVLGIRGGVYQNTNITTSCSFVKSGSAPSLTCGSATGVVTAGSSAVAGDNILVYVNYATGSLIDVVPVTVT